MGQSTVLRPTAPYLSQAGTPPSRPALTQPGVGPSRPGFSQPGASMSRSVFARSWVVPGSGPLPPVAPTRADPRTVVLPPLSDTVARAAALANDPDACLADFAALVRGDPAVTALLMKRANSAACGGNVTDVRQAVTMLGLRACSQLAASVGMRDLLRHVPPAVAMRCEAVLRHSLLVAHVASYLNKVAGTGFAGEEFVAGLLHDVGRVLLAMRMPDAVVAADPLDFDEGPDRRAGEKTLLGTDHCAAGAEFAAASRLSPAVVRAILRHHEPFEETGEHRRLTALVAVADHLVNYAQRTRRVADYEPWSGFGYAVLSESWPAERHDRFLEALPDAVVAALRETRHTLRDGAE